jgi:hypothetical protein
MKKNSSAISRKIIGDELKLYKKAISGAKYVINILGNKIYVQDISTLIRISHTSKVIQCNELFILLDNKVKQLAVLVTKNLLNKNREDERYFYSDKLAINKILIKYPKVDKIYWLFAFKVTFGEIITDLNLKRLKRIIKLLKLTENKVAKSYLKEYSDKIKFEKSALKVTPMYPKPNYKKIALKHKKVKINKIKKQK